MLWVKFIVSAFVFTSSLLSAQQPLFMSGVDLVHFGVSALNRDGSPIVDLNVEDFELYEDGKIQEIRYFSRGMSSDAETMPMHLGLLFDASSSMQHEDVFAKTAAIKFLNSQAYAADMTLVDFDTEVRVSRYVQDDFPRLVERIRRRESGTNTALYDALGVYLNGAFDQDGRKVLLLYSDGHDTRSRIRFHEVISLVKASDVTVYAIGFQQHLPSSLRFLEQRRLRELTGITGGYCYFPSSVDDLDEIYERITEELSARYSLGYVSTNPRSDGTWREVEIKIRESRRDLKRTSIRHRQGYFSPYIQSEDLER